LPENSTKMKGNKIGTQTIFRNQTKKITRLLVAALCLLTAHSSLIAQTCTLSCDNPIDAPANTSPDPTTCEVTLTIPSSGFASADCTGPYNVVVTNEDNNPLLDTLIYAEQNLNLGDAFNLGVLDLNQLIKVIYFHQADGNNCTNYFRIVDH